MTNYKEIMRLYSEGFSRRNIAVGACCAVSTVERVLKNAEDHEITYDGVAKLSNAEISKLLYPQHAVPEVQREPDYQYIHKELAKSGITLSLLWHEYVDACRIEGKIPYMYTQFCKHYHDWAVHTKATMHLNHKPGDIMQVDWAGQTARLKDNITGKDVRVYIFVATLPYSGFSYVEGFLDMKQDSWIAAHVHAYNYFGGITRILRPDNLKTGVIKNTSEEVLINHTYHDMAEHYGTCIIPARVRQPKDKAFVEGTVGVISTWIIAALRGRTYFSLAELNKDIALKLEEFNNKPFQKKEGSRKTLFETEERQFLTPLPQYPFELSEWKTVTVMYNYHVGVERMYYSVPYEYIKQRVDVRLSKNTVEVFYSGSRIASHVRLYGKPGQYCTVTDHMPEEHRQYAQWNGERFREWSENIGPCTAEIVDKLLATSREKEQAYKSCFGLLKLADKYSNKRLESACKRALTYTSAPSFKNIQSILRSGYDRLEQERPKAKHSEYNFTRGADYYGGEVND